MMNEIEFIDGIDCKFPFDDMAACKRLIKQALSISSNAAFMILHEIARAPRGKKVSVERLYEILEVWDQEFEHPLKSLLIGITHTMLKNQDLPVEDVLSAMDEIAKYRYEYSALNIAYFSCDDIDNIVDDKWQSIVNNWENA
jgi:hypothetical protein